jgi:hypothetical protein
VDTSHRHHSEKAARGAAGSADGAGARGGHAGRSTRPQQGRRRWAGGGSRRRTVGQVAIGR